MSVIIDDNGIKIQDTNIVLSEYQDIFKRIFGNSVDLTFQGVNGQIINELVLRESENDIKMLKLFNGFNIETSDGIFLDYISNLFGVKRREATPTIVNVKFLGLSGTIIPTGFKVQDNNKNIYETKKQNILVDGSVNIDCYAQVLGSIDVNDNSIFFYDNLSGLDSVDNEFAGITGNNIESDQYLRLRTIETRALNSVGVIESLYSGISTITNNFTLLNNNTLNPIVINSNITVPPHSIFLCIFGGDDKDIANILYRKNSAGVSMIGDVVVDLPTPFNSIFEAKFQRPDIVILEIVVNVKKDVLQIGDVVNISKNVIKSFFDSINIIGASFYSSEFIAELDKAGVIKINNLLIGIKEETLSEFIDLTRVQLGNLSISNITINEL